MIKKKMTALLAALSLLLALAGCGAQEGQEENAAPVGVAVQVQEAGVQTMSSDVTVSATFEEDAPAEEPAEEPSEEPAEEPAEDLRFRGGSRYRRRRALPSGYFACQRQRFEQSGQLSCLDGKLQYAKGTA